MLDFWYLCLINLDLFKNRQIILKSFSQINKTLLKPLDEIIAII